MALLDWIPILAFLLLVLLPLKLTRKVKVTFQLNDSLTGTKTVSLPAQESSFHCTTPLFSFLSAISGSASLRLLQSRPVLFRTISLVFITYPVSFRVAPLFAPIPKTGTIGAPRTPA